ncbi:MutL DNA mismatch repair protein [Dictyostelium discoideum AX4]|uniref:DNA mismatch repair protein Mlh1 n=1 Tax=Dictyostelium discoideum TaxID=44689 RepID=MLH1_DICDI|nr:MutL DNA mismatch repair protein [Dictyostelium discoideum AX4]Q54KD8.1 RecName: Full=DNA mismatch repair protein Mlh1; AltName: Full=MutL protein homolog 1 [Dictyostelium discoideum]EAL63764.1 MutL DNA mismatch repair protein [Dictyostelium discoideum AX4]|eukprot:XP_637285.1 MutL DNA mismatch repair protein [Dictyostelium discoideum AX4]
MDFLKSLPPLQTTDSNSTTAAVNTTTTTATNTATTTATNTATTTTTTTTTNLNNLINESKKKIHRLTQEVVNKISAGEVIQRPSNALKELLENCLDAKSTTITVTVKDGGMKFLQIQDNGSGIRLEDMGIVCERFTTSKLTKFEDLRSIQSFGFRGEALSSISHVSHLKILTKTADSPCAYRACYLNGKLTPPSPNEQSSDPKPCAGVNGTQITVEDLFFNTPSRKNVLKNTVDEHSRIVLLMKKYAINNPTVSFILKKQGDPTPEVHTSGGQNSLEKDVIGSLYGTDLSKELKIITIDPNNPNPNNDDDDNISGSQIKNSNLNRLDFTMKGFFSSTNYNSKKINFILFINGRLVDSKNLKTGLEQVYSKYLPKGTHPFMFIRLLVPPKNIDVNIHPTKSEVKILHEEQIIEFIQQKVDQELSISSNSKTFSTQILLPGFDQDNVSSSQKKQKNSQSSSTQTKSTNNNNNPTSRKEPIEYAKDKIRSDSKSQTLDAFLNPMDYNNNNDSSIDDNDGSGIGRYDDVDGSAGAAGAGGKFNDNLIFNDNSENEAPRDIDNPLSSVTPIKSKEQRQQQSTTTTTTTTTTTATTKSNSPASKNDIKKLQEHTFITPRKTRKYKQVELTSIKTLISEFQSNVHDGLKEFFNDCVFVGCLDHSYALVQFGKKLYLINLENITKELFYQLSLLRFSDFDSIKFSQSLSIYSLLLVSLDSPLSGWMESDGPKDKIADYLTKLLISKKELLNEYFSIEINEDGELVGIPQVLDHYVPCTDNLPIFLLKLATEVEWEFEKECFAGIVKEISSFFKIEPSFLKLRDTQVNNQQQTNSTTTTNNINFIKKDGKEWIIQHLIFPAFRKLSPPKKFANDGSVIQITTLDNLYKVFERC